MPKVTVRKSKLIKAPLDRVYADVRDFMEWPAWSPWLITEPDCKVTYLSDGRQYAWDGEVVGAGTMEVLSEEAPREIYYQLNFLKPFKSQAGVVMSFAKKGGGTEVTWSLESKLPFFLFFMRPMMTAMIGMDYERGLNMLKDKLETGKVPSRLEFLQQDSVSAVPYIGCRRQCAIDEVGPAMAEDLKKLHASSAKPAGKPFSIYHQWNPTKGSVDYTIGFPLEAALETAPEGFVVGERPACSAFVIKHTGAYRHLGNAWSAGINRARNKVFQQSKLIPPFEVYENDPCEVAEEDLVTTVYFPMR